jgi:hypothetical protein
MAGEFSGLGAGESLLPTFSGWAQRRASSAVEVHPAISAIIMGAIRRTG